MVAFIFAWTLVVLSIPSIALLRLSMTHGSINIGSLVYYIIYQSVLSAIILTLTSIGGPLTPGDIAMTTIWLLFEAAITFVIRYVRT